MFGTGYLSSDRMNDATWLSNAKSELKFCLLPRKCCVTRKTIWLKLAYRSRRHFRLGDIDFITEDRWYDKIEFLILRLKYNI